MMTTPAQSTLLNSLDARPSSESGTLTLIMTGRWDSDTTGIWWHGSLDGLGSLRMIGGVP